MPQRPQYCENIADSAEELFNIMDMLVKYGLGHEDIIYPIVEEALNGIYVDEKIKHATDMGEEVDEDGNFYFSATASALFGYVESESQEQFVHDLRNAISVAMTGDFNDPTNTVLGMRL